MKMNKIAATFGVLVISGGLSICELCDTNRASQLAASHQLVSVANAQSVSLPRVPAIKSVALKIKGMTCGGCVFGVRRVLSRLPGVSKADVSYEKGRAVVTYDPTRVTTSQMIAAIKTLGYSATIETLQVP